MKSIVALLLLLLLPRCVHASVRIAEPITSAEEALAHFNAACDNEIKRWSTPETMARINALRAAPSLTIKRQKPRDFAGLKDPKALAGASRHDLFRTHEAILTAKGDIWVITYDNMKGMEVFLDAETGLVLCVAFIPEG